jgi:hypothetical protein
VKIRKNLDGIYSITKPEYRKLWQKGCMEVSPLPPFNLENEVHELFRPEAFVGLDEWEYQFILPAVTLASRFIEDGPYLEFWKQLCTGRLVPDERPGRKSRKDEPKVKLNTLFADLDEDEDDDDATRLVEHSFGEIASVGNLTFFFLDEEWSTWENMENTAAESFIPRVTAAAAGWKMWRNSLLVPMTAYTTKA